MLPDPVEVADNQSHNHFRLLPHFTKLVLPSMPASGLLPQDSVGALIALRQCLTNVVVNLYTQDSFIASPTIRVPLTTSRFAFGTHNQCLNKLVRVLAYPSTQNQTAILGKTDANPAVPCIEFLVVTMFLLFSTNDQNSSAPIDSVSTSLSS